MRECVFCGARADSREHIIAKRLARRMRMEEGFVTVGRLYEGEGFTPRTPYSLDNFKVRHVCKSCNNGWMNDLEEWFEKRLGFLIEPEWPHLAEEMIHTALEERETLTRWLLKTAVTVDLGGMLKKRLFRPEQTRLVKDGAIPADTVVHLAWVRTAGLTCIGGRGFRVVNGGVFHPNQEFREGTGFRLTIQMNYLLLRIMRIPLARVRYREGSLVRPIRVWPGPSRVGVLAYEYADPLAFESAYVLEIDPPGG